MHLSTHSRINENHDKKAEQPSKRRHIKSNSQKTIKQPGGAIGAIAAIKPRKATFFTMILNNPETAFAI